MEVRLTHVSLTAQVDVHGPADDAAKRALPTIAHELSSGLRGVFPAKQAQQTKIVLADVSGVFRPGTITLVLGQPGSGKSSLLKLLSGRLAASKTVKLLGDAAYNGVPQAQFQGRLPQLASYVPQRERHFPTLTVQET